MAIALDQPNFRDVFGLQHSMSLMTRVDLADEIV